MKADFRLDERSRKPKSMQLADALRSALCRGVWKAGDVLPTIGELADLAHTSDKTARRALEMIAADGLTVPKRGIGSIVSDHVLDIPDKGRVLAYVRETGYSYYFSELISVMGERFLSKGYRMSSVTATGRSETEPSRRLARFIRGKWSLVILVGGGEEPRRVLADCAWPLVHVGDGSPLPEFSPPSLIGRVEIRSGKALPDFIRACVRRRVARVMQFKYCDGAFTVSEMLAHAGVTVETISIPRKSSPEEVSRAALSDMCSLVSKRALPDLFLFTDDYVAQGALTALAAAGIRVPEHVSVVTHANKGLGPVWVKPLSRLEMDPSSHAKAIADALIDYLRTGVFPPDLDLGSVWVPGETF